MDGIKIVWVVFFFVIILVVVLMVLIMEDECSVFVSVICVL